MQAGVDKSKAGILVDEQFGAAILGDAAAAGYITCCPAEKSALEEFDFEYGEHFAEHIEAFRPTFCKVFSPVQHRSQIRREFVEIYETHRETVAT